jgi:hypothetical protein
VAAIGGPCRRGRLEYGAKVFSVEGGGVSTSSFNGTGGGGLSTRGGTDVVGRSRGVVSDGVRGRSRIRVGETLVEGDGGIGSRRIPPGDVPSLFPLG